MGIFEADFIFQEAADFILTVKSIIQEQMIMRLLLMHLDMVVHITRGNLKNVKLLLADSRVSPADQNNAAIFYATENGHLNVVKLLLTREDVDPSASYNAAVTAAINKGHFQIVKLLISDRRFTFSDGHKFPLK